MTTPDGPQGGPRTGPAPLSDVAAVPAALARLVSAGTLTAQQADAVRRELSAGGGALPAGAGPKETTDGDGSWRGILSEVGGYIGATFVFAAAFTLAGPAWDDLPDSGRTALLLGPAVLMLGAAVAVALTAPGRWPVRGPGSTRRRLVSVLVIVAAALIGGAVGVATEPDRYLDGTDYSAQPALICLAILAVVGAGYLTCRSVLLHLAVAATVVGTLFTVCDWVDGSGDGVGTAVGLLVALFGLAWAAGSWLRVVDERVVGLAVGGVIIFIGAETMILNGTDAGYLLLFALAAAGLGGYVLTRDVPLLAVGSLTLAITVPQAVIDFSDGALGAAGALLVTGMSIVAVSVLGLRLRQSVPPTGVTPG